MPQTNTDVGTYKESLELVVKNLNKQILSSETDIVISLSRKGPKLLELLRKHYNLEKFSFITEHALPFVFEEICKNKDKKYRIFIVDDAIYFGSTIQNLYNEIKAYIAAYQLENVKIEAVVTAIKTQDSKALAIDDTLLLTFDENKIPKGYGHFFVKTLMNDFSEFNDTMEIEFPKVEYSIDETIDENRIEEVLKKAYPNVFRSEQNGESRAKWCITLAEGKTESFNKIRVFKTGGHLKFVFMNPHYFNNSVETLAGLMIGQGSPFHEIWNEIQSHFSSIDTELHFSNEIRRNTLRTQVILANFLLSFNNYLVEKRKIDSIVQELGRDATNSYRIEDRNLYYLIGNRQLVDNTIGRLKIAADSNLTLDSVMAVKEMTVNNDYVLENNSLPKEELEMLQSHNLIMLGKSKNTDEALSVVFNNLTILIEKWTRGTIYDDSYRLRFGYSMKNLATFVRRYSETEFEEQELFLQRLHKWVDGRIDSGCIVPQYIVDANTSTWMRVFRPGENEDLLLSHLARLVLHVWNKANDILGIKKVNTYTFQSVLAVIIDKCEDMLAEEEPYLNLCIDETLLPCIGNRKIIEYMKDMFILTEDNGFLEVPPRLIDKEFQSCTTLSRESVNEIDILIDQLLSPDVIDDNPFADLSGNIYYHLRNRFDIGRILDNIQRMKKEINLWMAPLLNDSYVRDLTEEEEECILSNYDKYIKPYLFSETKVVELKDLDIDQYRMEVMLQKMLSVYNILLLVYCYNDQDLLVQYLENETILPQIGMQEIVEYINSVSERNAGDEFKNDTTLIRRLSDFLESI